MSNKRIIYTGPFVPNLCDGVSSSMFDLLRFLKSRGHEVYIISLMHDCRLTRKILDHVADHLQAEIISRDKNYCNFTMKGINIFFEVLPYSRDEVLACHPNVLKRYLGKIDEYPESYFFTVDVDLTCLVAHSIARSSAAHFIHSPVCSIKLFSKNVPIFQKMLKDRTVFTVSRFSQEELKRALNIHANVWPPFIDFNRFRFSKGSKADQKIGYYSAGPHKGDNIVSILATKMPHHRFLVMGSNFRCDVECANVIHLGDTIDLESFYTGISLLLAPSVIAEGFSRVLLEASCNAIPVIANRVGGIPEALGNSGILVDIEPSEEKIARKYISLITKLLSEPDEYEQYSKKARERAQEYETELYEKSISYDKRFLNELRADS